MATNILHRRKSGHVGGLQRADHGITSPKRGAHHLIHHFCTGDAAFYDMQGFTQQCKLQTVADKSWRSAIQQHCFQLQ